MNSKHFCLIEITLSCTWRNVLTLPSCLLCAEVWAEVWVVALNTQYNHSSFFLQSDIYCPAGGTKHLSLLFSTFRPAIKCRPPPQAKCALVSLSAHDTLVNSRGKSKKICFSLVSSHTVFFFPADILKCLLLYSGGELDMPLDECGNHASFQSNIVKCWG